MQRSFTSILTFFLSPEVRALCLALALGYSSPYSQLLSFSFVLGVFLGLQAAVWPWRTNGLNWLELAVSVCVLVMVISTMGLTSTGNSGSLANSTNLSAQSPTHNDNLHVLFLFFFTLLILLQQGFFWWRVSHPSAQTERLLSLRQRTAERLERVVRSVVLVQQVGERENSDVESWTRTSIPGGRTRLDSLLWSLDEVDVARLNEVLHLLLVDLVSADMVRGEQYGVGTLEKIVTRVKTAKRLTGGRKDGAGKDGAGKDAQAAAGPDGELLSDLSSSNHDWRKHSLFEDQDSLYERLRVRRCRGNPDAYFTQREDAVLKAFLHNAIDDPESFSPQRHRGIGSSLGNANPVASWQVDFTGSQLAAIEAYFKLVVSPRNGVDDGLTPKQVQKLLMVGGFLLSAPKNQEEQAEAEEISNDAFQRLKAAQSCIRSGEVEPNESSISFGDFVDLLRVRVFGEQWRSKWKRAELTADASVSEEPATEPDPYRTPAFRRNAGVSEEPDASVSENQFPTEPHPEAEPGLPGGQGLLPQEETIFAGGGDQEQDLAFRPPPRPRAVPGGGLARPPAGGSGASMSKE